MPDRLITQPCASAAPRSDRRGRCSPASRDGPPARDGRRGPRPRAREADVQRSQIGLPLLERARPGDGGGQEAVVQNPTHRELDRRHAARLGMLLDRLRDHELSSRHSVCRMRLSPRAARVPCCGAIAGRVFAGEHAACQRRLGGDAEPVIAAGRQMLDLRHAVHRVVIGLADDRPVDAEFIAEPQISATRQEA